jgi:hypothetical protein
MHLFDQNEIVLLTIRPGLIYRQSFNTKYQDVSISLDRNIGVTLVYILYMNLRLKCLCHDLCNLLFVIIGIFYEEMQYIFIRKYSIFTGLSALKVTGYDIKPGIAN